MSDGDDFLAREAAVLGDSFVMPTGGGDSGEYDFENAASAFPDLDGDGDVPIPEPSRMKSTQGQQDGFDMDFGGYSRPAPTEVKVTGDDDLDQFDSQFPDIGGETFNPPPSTQPSFYSQPAVQAQPRPQQPFSPAMFQTQEEESEHIKAWRAKQEEEIRKRDEASHAKREETITKAESAIDEFYKNYYAKKERQIKENKETEADFKEKLSSTLSNGTSWSRICEIIELQNSQSKTLARSGTGTTDLTRYKEVLLRLKREGDTAPGAAGY